MSLNENKSKDSEFESNIQYVINSLDTISENHNSQYALVIVKTDGTPLYFASDVLKPFVDKILPIGGTVMDTSIEFPSSVEEALLTPDSIGRNRRNSDIYSFFGSEFSGIDLPTTNIDVSISSNVEDYLIKCFSQLQQLTCSLISKIWIKILEPKKQSNYPYNRGDSSKPNWWPVNVRHREPDHLKKPERVTLMISILRAAAKKKKIGLMKMNKMTKEWSLSNNESLSIKKKLILASVYHIVEHEMRHQRLGADKKVDALNIIKINEAERMFDKSSPENSDVEISQNVINIGSTETNINYESFEGNYSGSSDISYESPHSYLNGISNSSIFGLNSEELDFATSLVMASPSSSQMGTTKMPLHHYNFNGQRGDSPLQYSASILQEHEMIPSQLFDELQQTQRGPTLGTFINNNHDNNNHNNNNHNNNLGINSTSQTTTGGNSETPPRKNPGFLKSPFTRTFDSALSNFYSQQHSGSSKRRISKLTHGSGNRQPLGTKDANKKHLFERIRNSDSSIFKNKNLGHNSNDTRADQWERKPFKFGSPFKEVDSRKLRCKRDAEAVEMEEEDSTATDVDDM